MILHVKQFVFLDFCFNEIILLQVNVHLFQWFHNCSFYMIKRHFIVSFKSLSADICLICSEVRMQERVFLGIGNKPFMDIQPSEAAISDRAINYVLIGRGEYLVQIL